MFRGVVFVLFVGWCPQLLHVSNCVRTPTNIYVVVNFLPQVIFVFLLFLGMVMQVNEVETKEK